MSATVEQIREAARNREIAAIRKQTIDALQATAKELGMVVVPKEPMLEYLNGCPSCDWDEAEGSLLNHCDNCKTAATTEAFISWSEALKA